MLRFQGKKKLAKPRQDLTDNKHLTPVRRHLHELSNVFYHFIMTSSHRDTIELSPFANCIQALTPYPVIASQLLQ